MTTPGLPGAGRGLRPSPGAATAQPADAPQPGEPYDAGSRAARLVLWGQGAGWNLVQGARRPATAGLDSLPWQYPILKPRSVPR